MRVLFAAPDRDLLECYQKLLEADLGETVTAFDGTQVLFLLASETFDAAVLDRELPRVPCGTLIARMKEQKLPVIVLTKEPSNARRPKDVPSADAYLEYPFEGCELAELIRKTTGKGSEQEDDDE